jgi:K(+)-stimulated pyrophosphate-energized sodium pump
MKGVLAKPTGTPEMGEIAEAVQEGAMAYITRQFRTIGIIVIPLAVIVFLTSSKVIDEGSGEGLNFAQSGGFRTLAFSSVGWRRPRSGFSACGCPPGRTFAPPPPPRPTT